MRFILWSPIHFEKWNWQNSVEQGIGGSETSHVEMAWRLAKRSHEVITYGPLPEGSPNEWRGTKWYKLEDTDFDLAGIWVIYRMPEAAGRFRPKRADQKLWLMMQDWTYPWKKEDVETFDKILVLSDAHKNWLLQQEPWLEGKVWVTSNGLKPDLIEEVENEGLPVRNPRRIMYASSPDRGLEPLLRIFKRVREIVPDAELHTYYGFNNIDKLIKQGSMVNQFAVQKNTITELAQETPGVIMHGRVSQKELYKEWLTAGIWCYPSEFWETSPVHGDTIVETLAGPTPIRDLVGRDPFPVWSYDIGAKKLSISMAKNAKCTRRQAEVLTLALKPRSGRNAKKLKHLTLTPDHEVLTRNGVYVPAGELQVGDRVMAVTRRFNGWGADYPMIGVTGCEYKPAHRLAAEWAFGRPLEAGEIVDHLNGNTEDNSPQNLRVYPQAQHFKEHQQRDSSFAQKRDAGTRKFVAENPELIAARGRKAAEARWGKACNHVIVAIEKAEPADVYCMEVEPDHNFVANEIVVHNCITCMEAQAMGAVPVINPVWAQGENTHFGIHIQGKPYSDTLTQARFAAEVAALCVNKDLQERIRKEMMPDARKRWSWENFVDQWEDWAHETTGFDNQSCRICGSSKLDGVVDLGQQPLATVFPRDGEAVTKAPLRLVKCECGLHQLDFTVRREKLFAGAYGYRSGMNDTMRNHLSRLAAECQQFLTDPKDLIIDIGANDGFFIKQFPLDRPRLGFEPSDACPTDFSHFIKGFFKPEVLQGKAKVITSIAMFYDLQNPLQFCLDVASTLDKDGVWVNELQYLPKCMEMNAFDTICHEHLTYWTLADLARVYRMGGLEIFKYEFNDSNGGSVRTFARLREALTLPLELPKEDLGKFDPKAVRRGLEALLLASGRVFGYGASTKGNVLLQYCQIGTNLIEAVADRNPQKWGCKTITGVPIISEEEMRREKPDRLLMLPWSFAEEFRNREPWAEWIVPLPTPHIIARKEV